MSAIGNFDSSRHSGPEPSRKIYRMDEERPSFTAEGPAIMRALHQTLAEEPKILNDPIALRLVDPQSEIYNSRVELLERLPELARLRFQAMFVMRSRYAEDCLAEAFRGGVRQYVLLGAGLDTFAYRQPLWANELRIFEVDHPGTQRSKRKRLTDASISLPDNVAFVPVDFEKISLATALKRAGLDLGAATFFSMLGVSQYLTAVALDETWRFVVSRTKGSQIVFSFVAADGVLPADDIALVKALAARSAAVGEPWLSRFLPEQLIAKLTEIGFSKVFHLTADKANKLYFQNRRDSLNAALMEQMMRATV
jgi:methyltransferase (TIGR00027 family)